MRKQTNVITILRVNIIEFNLPREKRDIIILNVIVFSVVYSRQPMTRPWIFIQIHISMKIIERIGLTRFAY